MAKRLMPICSVAVGVALAIAGWANGIGAPGPRLVDKSLNAVPVDVELVLAVDVSYSMDPDEQALQREGYITGLTSREFMQALRSGANGKIAITYFEWAGVFDQKIIVPWRLIEGPESADAFVNEVARAPYRRASRTSISGALNFEGKIFKTLPLLAWRPGNLTRRYIDGERARFVSPLALFLFSVFLLFATFQLAGGSAVMLLLGFFMFGRLKRGFYNHL